MTSAVEKLRAKISQREAEQRTARSSPSSSTPSSEARYANAGRTIYSDDEERLKAVKKELKVEHHLQQLASAVGGRVELEAPEDHLSGEESWKIIFNEKKTALGTENSSVPVRIDASWDRPQVTVGHVSGGTERGITEERFTDLLAEHTLSSIDAGPHQVEMTALGRLVYEIKHPGLAKRLAEESKGYENAPKR